MKILIENSSQENEIMFDPFMGIGSTIIACINTNRQYISCEIDTAYWNIANKRIQDIVLQTH
jgi:site-specific DNA-methyltransferase (adenine-specific)